MKALLVVISLTWICSSDAYAFGGKRLGYAGQLLLSQLANDVTATTPLAQEIKNLDVAFEDLRASTGLSGSCSKALARIKQSVTALSVPVAKPKQAVARLPHSNETLLKFKMSEANAWALQAATRAGLVATHDALAVFVRDCATSKPEETFSHLGAIVAFERAVVRAGLDSAAFHVAGADILARLLAIAKQPPKELNGDTTFDSLQLPLPEALLNLRLLNAAAVMQREAAMLRANAAKVCGTSTSRFVGLGLLKSTSRADSKFWRHGLHQYFTELSRILVVRDDRLALEEFLVRFEHLSDDELYERLLIANEAEQRFYSNRSPVEASLFASCEMLAIATEARVNMSEDDRLAAQAVADYSGVQASLTTAIVEEMTEQLEHLNGRLKAYPDEQFFAQRRELCEGALSLYAIPDAIITACSTAKNAQGKPFSALMAPKRKGD